MGETKGRLAARLLRCSSSAASVSSSFEVDTDSWMMEEQRAPLAEEEARRKINGLRLDMVMLAHTHTVNTGLFSCRRGKGHKKKKKFHVEEKKPKAESVNKSHTSQRC